MGTMYYVGCRDCKVVRDLDKFYSMREVDTRDDMEELAGVIESKDSYRAALLVSFMGEHRGHDCVAFTEHNDDICDEFRVGDRMLWEPKDWW